MGCCVSKEVSNNAGGSPPSSGSKGKGKERENERDVNNNTASVDDVRIEEKPAEPKPLQEEDEAVRDQKLQKIFSQVDKDNSGFVDITELKELLERMQLKVDHDSVVFMMSRYDDDNNGRLNFEEFSEMVLSILNAKKIFAAADKDNSGAISRSELQTHLSSINFTPDISNKIFNMFDEDTTGTVEFAEFLDVIFYINEIEYQYKVFQERVNDNFKWLGPLLGSENSSKIIEVGKELTEFKKRSPFPSVSEFAAPIVRAAASGVNNPLGRPLAAPKIKAQRARIRPPPKKVIKIQPSEFKKYVDVSGAPFVDKDFPPSLDILPPGARARVKEWKRIHEINPNAKLFVNGVDEGDVIQGMLGDCWVLGALAVVATSAENFVEHLFVQQIPESGYYQCRFFKNGVWINIEIDDRLPCDERGHLVFAKCKDPTEFWVPLVEKAYAKLHGSYSAIESGSIADALKDLTGEGVEVVHIDGENYKKNSNLAWQILTRNSAEGFLMGCAIDAPQMKQESELSCGLLTDHAYSIINCVEVNGNKLIRMRNPWGQGEWNGAWSDSASEWTPALLQQLNYEFANDGTFFIAFNDFFNYFSRVYVLRLLTDDVGEVWHKSIFEGHWTGETAVGCANNANWLRNPQYSLRVLSADTKLFVNLSQPDLRYILKKSPAEYDKEYHAIGLYVLKAKDLQFRKMASPPEDKVAASTFTTLRDLSFEVILQPGDYVIIPSSFHPGVEVQYGLSVYANKPVQISELTQIKPSKSITGHWKGASAGGCANNSGTWMNNPQFLLTCSTPGDIEIFVAQEIIKNKDLDALGIYAFGPTQKARMTIASHLALKPSTIINLHTVSETLKVEADANYIIMPTTFEQGLERQFTITVSSVNATISEFIAV